VGCWQEYSVFVKMPTPDVEILARLYRSRWAGHMAVILLYRLLGILEEVT